jgi:hypothetical protein
MEAPFAQTSGAMPRMKAIISARKHSRAPISAAFFYATRRRNKDRSEAFHQSGKQGAKR